jgi:hypothetical protein
MTSTQITDLRTGLLRWLDAPDAPDAIRPSQTDRTDLLHARRYEDGTYVSDEATAVAQARAEIDALPSDAE